MEKLAINADEGWTLKIYGIHHRDVKYIGNLINNIVIAVWYQMGYRLTEVITS